MTTICILLREMLLQHSRDLLTSFIKRHICGFQANCPFPLR